MARRNGASSVRAGRLPAPTEEENPDPEPDPDQVAHTICLRLLTIRARTRSELSEALSSRNIAEPSAARVLDRLAKVGLIDDVGFARNFVRNRQNDRGLAPYEIGRQLRSKGVDAEVIDQVMADEVDPGSEYEIARQLAERKLRSLARFDPAVQQRRLAGLLARKGYSPSLTYRIVREVVAAGPDEVGAAELELE